MGRYRKPTVPQLDRNAGRNDKAQRLAAFGGRAGRPDLAGQYLLDVRELVEIDVNNFGAVEEHLRKMIDDYLLKEEDIGDRVKVARIVQKLLNGALDLPDKPWHDWDDWAKGLE